MRRWQMTFTCVALVGLTRCAGSEAGGEPEQREKVATSEVAAASRPNIVFILLDDLDQATTPYWDVMTQSQALLAGSGMTFTNAFAPTPICCAARATLLTGKFGHNTFVLTNGGEVGGYSSFTGHGNEENTVAVWLHNAGYKTMLAGKYMNGYQEDESGNLPHVPPGWDEWYADVDAGLRAYMGYDYNLNENGSRVHYGLAEGDYFTDVIGGKAVDFIERNASSTQPFFMYIAPTAPHLPLPPARRHRFHPYRNSTAPHSPNFNEPDISDKATWLRASGARRAEQVTGFNDTDWRDRMGSLYAVDEMIAGIFSALAAAGKLDNTVVIFTSDNGYNLGAHRLLHKMAPYEESIRVPLVIRGPGIPAGTIEPRIALHVDFAATVAELAGATPSSTVDGRSLLPMLQRDPIPGAAWRTDFIAQYHGGAAANGVGAELPPAFQYLAAMDVPSYRAVRTATHVYIEWYNDLTPEDTHEYELYDLRNDRFQLSNMLATPAGWIANRNLQERLAARLDVLGSCSGTGCN